MVAVPPGQLCLSGLDAGLHGFAQLVTFPGGVGAHLIEHPGRFLVCPVGVGPGGIRARLGRGGPLLGGPGGLLVLARLFPCLVTVGLGGADEGLSIGAGLADQLLGLPLGLRDPGLSSAHRGVGVGVGPPDRLVRLRAGLADGFVGLTARLGDGLVGFLTDGLPGCLVLDDPVPQFRPGSFRVGAGGFRVGLGRLGCLISGKSRLALVG